MSNVEHKNTTASSKHHRNAVRRHGSRRFTRRLAAYSSFAAGAGVGLFAAESTSAAVVPFTPPGGPVTIFQGGNYKFDIDGDGIDDFRMRDNGYFGYRLSGATLAQQQTNLIKRDGYIDGYSVAAIVAPGGSVGPDITGWDSYGWLEYFIGTRGYAGVVFDIPGGSPHFTYLDISVAGDRSSATLYGGAYESQANTPIRVPVPEAGSLTLLASGAAGLAAWRRNRGNATFNSAR
jgi:hypothetical protein